MGAVHPRAIYRRTADGPAIRGGRWIPVNIQVKLNGEPRELPGGTTMAQAVAGLTPAAAGVAAAVNGEVVPRGSWAATPLRDGDQVEVVTAVQGGGFDRHRCAEPGGPVDPGRPVEAGRPGAGLTADPGCRGSAEPGRAAAGARRFRH